jgi:hypothetical protein
MQTFYSEALASDINLREPLSSANDATRSRRLPSQDRDMIQMVERMVGKKPRAR